MRGPGFWNLNLAVFARSRSARPASWFRWRRSTSPQSSAVHEHPGTVNVSAQDFMEITKATGIEAQHASDVLEPRNRAASWPRRSATAGSIPAARRAGMLAAMIRGPRRAECRWPRETRRDRVDARRRAGTQRPRDGRRRRAGPRATPPAVAIESRGARQSWKMSRGVAPIAVRTASSRRALTDLPTTSPRKTFRRRRCTIATPANTPVTPSPLREGATTPATTTHPSGCHRIIAGGGA